MNTVSPPARSTFVSVLAWIFIVISGLTTLISVLQNIMISVMFPIGDMQELARTAKGGQNVPPFAAFMFEYMRFFFLAFLLLAVATLASSIGLLLRKNWARLVFVGLMGFGILWNIAGVAFSFFFAAFVPPMPQTTPNDFGNQFDLMMKVMIAVNILMAVAFSVLFGWIIKRLVSVEVRREFSAA